MTTAIIVDFRKMRCGRCKVAFEDKLSKECKHCGSIFKKVVSNHVGLAEKLIRERGHSNGKRMPNRNPDDIYPNLVGS